MDWPSTRVVQGGIFNPPKVKYSAETASLLKDLMEESKLSMLQRKKVNYSLRSGEPLPDLNSSRSTPRAKTSETSVRSGTSKRRSQQSIVDSGAYERDRYVPKYRGIDREHAKTHLQNTMMYGKDAKEILKPKPKKIKDDKIHLNRFDECKQEIHERVEFLKDMKKLGKDHLYKQLMDQQIASRIREMRKLQPSKS